MNNNNRQNNNRRRGRGTRQNNGGQQLNRIDSRARGNAPQLLEKYRKLAQDAHLNGDRVTAEYYLQFADHYFRVIADQRKSQDEQRVRRDERWEGSTDDAGDSDDFSADSDFPSFDQPNYARQPARQGQDERPREDRPRDDRPRDDRPREDRPREDRPREDRPREDRQREDRPRRAERSEPEVIEPRGDAEASAEDQPSRNLYEPVENPFVREPGTGRGLRPRREDRRPRRDDVGSDLRESGDGPGIDPAILPPAIVLSASDLAADDLPPAPKRRGRPRKTPAADGGETLAPVDQD